MKKIVIALIVIMLALPLTGCLGLLGSLFGLAIPDVEGTWDVTFDGVTPATLYITSQDLLEISGYMTIGTSNYSFDGTVDFSNNVEMNFAASKETMTGTISANGQQITTGRLLNESGTQTNTWTAVKR